LKVGVHGAKDQTPREAWEIVSKAIGKPIKVVTISLEQQKSTMKGYGVPDYVIDLYQEMTKGFLDGRITSVEPRTPETTTTTTIHEWAQTTFKYALEAAAAKK
jgi:ABC-type nitrate/sulfonate/bicarbonate transport system substrate-binding protein